MKALVLLTLAAASVDRAALARLLDLPLTERAALALTAPQSSLPLQLLGTAVDRHREIFSAALVRHTQTGKVRTVFLGDEVERAVVVEIARGLVTLNRGGVLEQLRLNALPSAPAPVTKTASGYVHVSTSDLAPWMAVRVLPTRDGLKLFGIQPGSPYEKLGIQNGDVLRTVNGAKVDFSTVRLIQPGVALTVELERSGQTYTLQGQLD